MNNNEHTLLLEWMKYCEIQSECQDVCRLRVTYMNYALLFPAVILSTVSGSANIGVGSSNSDSCNNSQSVLTIIFGTMSLISAALYTFIRTTMLPEKAKEHAFYSDEYQKLAQEIKLQIATHSHAYRNQTEFVKQCKRNLDYLIDKAPIVDGSILKRITKKYNDNIISRIDAGVQVVISDDTPNTITPNTIIPINIPDLSTQQPTISNQHVISNS